VVAFGDRGEPVGAAWYRLFPPGEPGFGFVDERTPELSLAVIEEARGRGIGTRLLLLLLDRARDDGFQALSLSVEPDNPARRLYERHGFVRVGGAAGLDDARGLASLTVPAVSGPDPDMAAPDEVLATAASSGLSGVRPRRGRGWQDPSRRAEVG
jgi:Acetyltransferase (GNAT) family